VTGIKASEVIAGTWKETTALLIIPGGADKVYHAQLQGEGNRQIRNYVEQGGKVLGVCAGAYYCAKDIQFGNAESQAFPIIENRELGFFPGTASGPIIPYTPGTQDLVYSATIFDIHGRDGNVYHALYNGGCYFPYVPTYTNCEWISSINHEGEKWVIVGMHVGKGYVIASGIHPEVCSTYYSTTNPGLAEILRSKEITQGCYALLRMIFTRFGFACISHVPTPEQTPKTRSSGGVSQIFSSPGAVQKVLVKIGDKVAGEQVVAIIDAMKMEHVIKAPHPGIIEFVAQIGQMLSEQDVVCEIKK
jgi:glutamine amidotransferase-like uncharacterized protein